jgi:predicted phosphoadenosine phosphosulfate sulfurtransferase
VGSLNRAAEYTGLLGCDMVSPGEWFRMFRRVSVLSSSGLIYGRRKFTLLIRGRKPTRNKEMKTDS